MLSQADLKDGRELSKAWGLDNFEDFLNEILRRHFDELRFAENLGNAIGDRVVKKLKGNGAGSTAHGLTE